LVGNFLTKVEDNGHGHHLTTSSIFDDGSKISLKNNTEITGSVIITSTIVSQGTTLVSGSGQISYAGITNIPSGIISGSSQVISLLPAGTVSGSSQVLNGSGVWSGSAQLPSGIVSGSSQISFNGITDKPALVSGSSQISFGSITGVPSGLVSGSSQVLAGTTIHSGAFFNGISVVSGSAQISFNGITDKPTLVSGSSQITYGSISSIPSGIVSGSAQIDLTATTNYSTGIKTRLNAEGVLSGSAQVVAALPSGTVSGSAQIIAGLPSGTVSGSAQITLSSTTGYGSVLNQAVLTTSTPTFAGLTLNGTQTISSGGSYPIQAISTQRYIIQARNSANSINTNYGWWWFVDTNFNMGFHADGASDRFTLTRDGNLSVSGTISASNFSGTSSGTNTGDQTLNSLGALSNDSDSEQDLGGRHLRLNHGSNRINMDPRWNESGYDANMGVFHMYSTTAAGVQWGRTGIALYNGSAYQYITTKDALNNIYINNNVAIHAGNFTSYAMSGAGYSANQNLNTNSNVTFNSVTGAITSSGNGDGNAPFRFGADYSGWMSIVAGAPGSNNGWGLFWAGNASAQYGTNGASGPGNIWGNSDNPNEYVFVGNGGSRMSIYGNNGNVWMGGDVRMDGSVGVGTTPALKFHVRGSNEMVRFENTSTSSGQYCQLNMRAGNRNAYLWIGNENSSSWAGAGGLNIYTENGNIDFWSNAVQRVRIQTDGHMVPYANNSYDLGSSSLGWRNVYTNDLHLSNMNKPEGNDVDGTNGNWTIQEGAENLYIINNNNGKKFKISLEEII
jgi:hypothetical protein